MGSQDEVLDQALSEAERQAESNSAERALLALDDGDEVDRELERQQHNIEQGQGSGELVQFVSKHNALRLVLVPSKPRKDDFGGTTWTQEVAVEFENGWFRTRDPRLVKWMRRHPNKDRDFAGFHEVVPPPPDPTPILRKVTAAAIAHDADGLADLWEEESKTHKRPEVLQSIESGLEALGIYREDKVPEAAQEPDEKG